MNWQKYLKISLLVIILILIGGYVYLRMKGMWVTVVVKGKKVMVGAVPTAEPVKVQQAFTVLTESNVYGAKVREPKFVHDRWITGIDGNAITAMDDAGNKAQYLWQGSTAYYCQSIGWLSPNVPVPNKPTDLAPFRFFFYGDGPRGVMGAEGLSTLMKDFTGQNLIKLYLETEQKDESGKYTLVGVVMFPRETCFGGQQ